MKAVKVQEVRLLSGPVLAADFLCGVFLWK